MALEYVLHGRYLDSPVQRGSSTYGTGGPEGACLSQLEAPFTNETIDVSRQKSIFDYFSTSPGVYLPGSAGIYPAGSGSPENPDNEKQAVNRVANFMNDVYFLVGDKVFRWNDDTSEWIISVTLDKLAAESDSIGLYPVNVGGIPKLVTAWYINSANLWKVGSLNGLTGQWNTSSSFTLDAPDDNQGAVITEHQHNNRVYFTTLNEVELYFIDFESMTGGIIDWPITVKHPMDFCTYFNELYCLNKDGALNVLLWKISEEVGAEAEFIATYPRSPSEHAGVDQLSSIFTGSQREGRNLLYVDSITNQDAIDKPKLITYSVVSGFSEKFGTLDDTAHGFESIVYQIPPGAPAVTGLQSFPSIGFVDNPLKMMVNQLGAGENTDAAKGERMVVRAHLNQYEKFRGDGEFTANRSVISCVSRFGMFCGTPQAGAGGDEANVMFQHTSSPSGEFQFFAFQKEGRHRSFPHEKFGGGARVSVVNSDGDKIIGITYRGTSPTPGIEGSSRIFYQLHTTVGHPNGTEVNVRWFYDENGHAAEKPCSLVGANAGSISGNIVFGIIADSGTLNHVDWDAKGDGLISATSKVNLMGMAAVTGEGGGGLIQIDDPTDIAGLGLWLDADDLATISSGVGISSWTDKSNAAIVGSLTQGTSAQQPDYLWGEQNGRNGILFDGTDDYLFSNFAPASGLGMTMFMVYEPRSSAVDQHIFSLSSRSGVELGPGNSTDHEFMSIAQDGTTGDLISQGTGREIDSVAPRKLTHSTVTINNPHFIYWKDVEFISTSSVDNGSEINSDFVTDGEVIISGVANTTVGRFTGAENSGVFDSAGNYANVVVYEIAVYSGILSGPDINSFRLYAEDKWGL